MTPFFVNAGQISICVKARRRYKIWQVNAVGLKDRDLAQSWLAEVAAIEADVEQMVNEIAATAAQRGGF